MPLITHLIPARRDPALIAIRVDGKSAATVHRRHVERLHLAVATEWTSELASQVNQAAAFDKAAKQAMAMLNRRTFTAAQMRAKLLAKGVDAALVTEVVSHLRSIGAIDDAAVGRGVMEESSRKPTGVKLLRAKLAQRGLDGALIDKLVADASATRSPVAAARELVDTRLRSMATLDDATRKRRLWGLLARRGFDEEVIEQVLGGEPD